MKDEQKAGRRKSSFLLPPSSFILLPSRQTAYHLPIMTRWHLTDELAAVWPTDADPIAAWLAAGVAAIVKRSPQRTVYRVRLPAFDVYVKQHHLPDRTTWLRQCLRAPKAQFEFERMRELARRGVSAPVPLGWGSRPGVLGVGESILVTRALDDVVPLNELRPDCERRSLAVALGRFVAQMHGAGVLHGDLHPGNFLVRRGGEEIFLVDLDAVRLGAPLDESTSFGNLAMLTAGFARRTGRSDRLRFLAAYAWNRGWDADLHFLAREIERRAHDYNLEFWRRRDQRSLHSNRYFRRVSGPSTTGHAVRNLDPAWLDAFLRDPDGVFEASPLLKNSRSSTVASTSIEIDGASLPVIVKRFRVTSQADPWTALVRPTAALRSWLLGHGLLERGIPTARPLVVLHRRQAGLVREGYLVTEKFEPVQELNAYVRSVADLPPMEARGRLVRQVERVAQAVRDLHRCRLSHRDLKAANLLVTSVAAEETSTGAPRPFGSMSVAALPRTTNLWFIDLVGVRLHDHLGRRRRVQNLARLNVSFLEEPLVSRADRLRFLRVYLGWGIHGKNDWKSWWRQIASATAAKVDRNRRSGRVLA
jgi:tRNA A-37 threonylcarbamoyl transferase component Bud32